MDANDRRQPASVTLKPVAGNSYAACVIVLETVGESQARAWPRWTAVGIVFEKGQQLVHTMVSS